MKREKLRRNLAFMMLEELGTHQLTMPNVDRYVIPKRTLYRINKNEKITEVDKTIAMLLVMQVCAQKPTNFRFARGDVWTQQRKDAIMSADLPVDKSFDF